MNRTQEESFTAVSIDTAQKTTQDAPFDTSRLDALLAEAGVDLVLATSRPNSRYLLGGYCYWINATEPAVGCTQWLPFVGYPAGRSDEAFYVGNLIDGWHQTVEPLWLKNVRNSNMAQHLGAQHTVEEIKRLGLDTKTIAIERSFLTVDAFDVLRAGLPQARFIEAGPIMERQRAIKAAWELDQIRAATEKVTEAMMAVFSEAPVGESTLQLNNRLRDEQVKRDLTFDFSLVSAGTSILRKPSPDVFWQANQFASLDSGGNLNGFIGDIARMGIRGEPSSVLKDIMDDILGIQNRIAEALRPGRIGRDVVDLGRRSVRESRFHEDMFLDIHGLGYVTHEQPRLISLGDVTPDHIDEPLQAGYVVSIETSFQKEGFGFVKIEDTVFVNANGPELVGDLGRGWNVQ